MSKLEVAPPLVEELERVAADCGLELEAALEQAVLQFIASRSRSDEEIQAEWDSALSNIRSRLPKDISPEEIEADIDAATDEVWAERRARRR